MKEVGLFLITVTSLLAMKSTRATVTIIVNSNNTSRVTGSLFALAQVCRAFLFCFELLSNWSELNNCHLSQET